MILGIKRCDWYIFIWQLSFLLLGYAVVTWGNAASNFWPWWAYGLGTTLYFAAAFAVFYLAPGIGTGKIGE